MNQLNRNRVLEFRTDQESELRILMHQIEDFAPEILGMKGYQIYDGVSEVKRAGWIRPQVGIPSIYAESVLEHCMNVKNGADALIIGTPNLVQVPQNFPIMGKVHDMPEGHGVLPDITPHCKYTNEQREILEKYAVLYIEYVLGQKGNIETQLLREYIEQKTPDSKTMFYLDKIDAGVKALDYEKLGFKKQVSIFHPYTIDKISESDYFTKIYSILLEREFKYLPSHFQYFMLLEMAGNYDEWRYRIKQLENNN
ncbi:MAG: HD domain-containing protein [Candidatus Gracilibacteria bacterium]|nr:HD domain-containing protein [Candidatus Gracilibacteria bacterium]